MRDSSSSNACEDAKRKNKFKGSAYSQTAGSEIFEYGNVSLDCMKPDPAKKISTNIRWPLY